MIPCFPYWALAYMIQSVLLILHRNIKDFTRTDLSGFAYTDLLEVSSGRSVFHMLWPAEKP